VKNLISPYYHSLWSKEEIGLAWAKTEMEFRVHKESKGRGLFVI